jgi:hypothetical protein
MWAALVIAGGLCLLSAGLIVSDLYRTIASFAQIVLSRIGRGRIAHP